jgi:hypothetical protein
MGTCAGGVGGTLGLHEGSCADAQAAVATHDFANRFLICTLTLASAAPLMPGCGGQARGRLVRALT